VGADEKAPISGALAVLSACLVAASLSGEPQHARLPPGGGGARNHVSARRHLSGREEICQLGAREAVIVRRADPHDDPQSD
jgi:hypothetical protein